MNIKTIRDTNGNIILKTYIPPTIEVEELEDEGIMAGSIKGKGEDFDTDRDGDEDPMSKQGSIFFDFDSDDSDGTDF